MGNYIVTTSTKHEYLKSKPQQQQQQQQRYYICSKN
jgi:hypothetical protein